MRILHVSTYSYHGAGSAALRLHQGLLNQGQQSEFLCSKHRDHEVSHVHVVAPKRVSVPLRVAKRLWRLIGFYESPLARAPKNAQYEMFTSPRAPFRLEDHPLVRDADVINLHWISGLVNFKRFFGSIKKPIVWTLHDMNAFMGCFHYSEEDVQHRDRVAALDCAFRKEKSEAYESSSLCTIVAPSRWLTDASSASELLGGYDHLHIPNGVDTSVYRPYNQRLAKEVFQLPEDHFVLLFVGTNVDNRRKGFDLLAGAMQSLVGEDRVVLAVVGVPPRDQDPQVRYLGSIHDERLMALAYSAADASILPSREDNFPNVMLESLACGTPLVATPVGGMREVIRNGFNGYLADSLSAEALRKAIENLIDPSGVLDRVAIRLDAVEKFDLALQARRYLDLYERLDAV